MVGFMAVVGACIGTGFAGVYFEKMLKNSETSLWLKNVQMSLNSVFISFFVLLVNNNYSLPANGFLYGYTESVCGVCWR